MSDENRLGELLWGRQGGIWALVSGYQRCCRQSGALGYRSGEPIMMSSRDLSKQAVPRRIAVLRGDERRSEEYGNEPLSKVGIAVVKSASGAEITVVDVKLDDGDDDDDDGQEGIEWGKERKKSTRRVLAKCARPVRLMAEFELRQRIAPRERRNRRADIKTGMNDGLQVRYMYTRAAMALNIQVHTRHGMDMQPKGLFTDG
ncbi:hypothetical protein BKA70DRAFT_1414126 [Coprinopsis sp. MPI-PUGE-AT-0042]|nr:hypothetical protein BKA70DRAFT_1414126 [Coprinopsis sp. MPI-PUGE-AT-0042]